MKLSIVAGATSQSINIFVQDSSSTTGAGLTGLAFNTASLTAYYTFAGANATATAITLATLSLITSAYSSGGFKEIDATNMPGWYRLDIPDAALATSKGRSVAIHLKGATNMAPLPIEIELTATNNQDGVHFGLTCLPNATAGANTGLPVVGTQVPNATAGAANGLLISGTNSGTVTLAALTISGATTLTGNLSCAAGITITNSTLNGAGVSITGNGTGDGINATGGSGGVGIHGVGGTTTGNCPGIYGQATTADNHGIKGLGAGLGAGMGLNGGTTGNGMTATAGASGSGAGFILIGGATGDALQLTGGATSGRAIFASTSAGDAIVISPIAGHGINITANGTSKHGLFVTGGTAGTSDGVKAVAGTGGVDIRGNLTGNVTGNLSGSAGSVTGAVGSVTGAVGSVTGAVGSVTGNVGGSVGSVTGNLGGNVVGDVQGKVIGGGASAITGVGVQTNDDALTLSGTINDASPTASSFTCSSGLSATLNFYNHNFLVFTSGTLKGLAREITGWSVGRVASFTTAFPSAPANGDSFDLIGYGGAVS